MPSRRSTRHVVLLRGVNLAGRNRVPMADLRILLGSEPGFTSVETYVQSGNVVLSSSVSPALVAQRCRSLVAARFGIDVDVIVRSGDELEEVVRRDPIGSAATDPRRYQVTFLEHELPPEVLLQVHSTAVAPEQVVAIGCEIYAWHPDGVGRSKLATLLSSRRLGVAATARNWRTVTALLDLVHA